MGAGGSFSGSIPEDETTKPLDGSDIHHDLQTAVAEVVRLRTMMCRHTRSSASLDDDDDDSGDDTVSSEFSIDRLALGTRMRRKRATLYDIDMSAQAAHVGSHAL